MTRTILLSDCQSFYASVEKAAHPQYRDRPVAVAGDPARRSGIILAACPIAKSKGVSTAETIGEALGKCPDLVLIQPRMQTYIDISLLISQVYETFTDLVEPFSIDEQFLDITGTLHLFGSAEAVARQIQNKVMLFTGVWVRIGISTTKILAKMAVDIFAKKNESGIFTLPPDEVERWLWPQPIDKMFGIGQRMTAHCTRLGIQTIGDMGRMPLSELKRKMRVKLGKNSDILAEVLWQTANGQDASPVKPSTHNHQKAVGHQMTLPRDYTKREDIKVVLLELSEEVGRRSRAKGYMGRVVMTGAQGASFDHPTGFYRQTTVPDPTNITLEIYAAAQSLFFQHWDGLPVRKVAVTLAQLADDREYQLTMFGNRERIRSLEKTTDAIKQRYGSAAILRAASLLKSGQAFERSVKIGGHYK